MGYQRFTGRTLIDQLIKDRFNNIIFQEAMRRYGIQNDQIHSLDALENFIYEFERGPHTYILRITHSLRRSESLVLGEVDWINYLAEGGVSVAKAIQSESGILVEVIEDEWGGAFLVTAFVKARGQAPWHLSNCMLSCIEILMQITLLTNGVRVSCTIENLELITMCLLLISTSSRFLNEYKGASW